MTARLARAALLSLLAGCAALIPLGAGPASAASDGVVSIKRELDNARERSIADFWTRRRMHRAEPLDVGAPRLSGARVPVGAGRASGDPAYLPPLEPGGGPMPVWRAGTLEGERTPLNHPAAFSSGEVADQWTPPQATNGKVFGFLPGFGAFECSATALTAPNRSLVFTASHCLVDPGHPFARKFVFVPAYRDGMRPYGTWVGERLFSPEPWVEHQNFNFDFGAVVVAPRNGAALEDVVGARGLAVGQPREQTYDAYGYPGNRFHAERMWHCVSGYEGTDPMPIARGPDPSAIGCDMGLGASGGAWVIQDRFINSVTSFTYRSHPDILYGPYLQQRARELVEKAGGA